MYCQFMQIISIKFFGKDLFELISIYQTNHDFFFLEREQNKVEESAVWRATKANVIQHQCKIFPHWKYEWNEEWKKAENEKIAE